MATYGRSQISHDLCREFMEVGIGSKQREVELKSVKVSFEIGRPQCEMLLLIFLPVLLR